MNNLSVQDGKTIAIISYITIIGTLVAFIMNQNKRNSFASFHIRQALGIFLTGVLVNFIQRYTDFGWVLGIGVLVLWVMGLIGAIQGEEKRVPLLGDQFQEWFRNIA